MASILIGIFTFILVLVCILLVLVILMQRPSANAGMGASLGGRHGRRRIRRRNGKCSHKNDGQAYGSLFRNLRRTLFGLYLHYGRKLGRQSRNPFDFFAGGKEKSRSRKNRRKQSGGSRDNRGSRPEKIIRFDEKFF